MSRIVVALFEQLTQARDACEALKQAGFTSEEINLIASDPSGTYTKYLQSTPEDADAAQDIAQGASVGALVGGLGGLLLGLTALVIPGIGPVLAAGPIVTTLAGAGVGAIAGGMIGMLTDLGVPREQAGYYAEGVRRGGILLTVRTDAERDDRALQIIQGFQPTDVKQHASFWQEDQQRKGEDAALLTPQEIDQARSSQRTGLQNPAGVESAPGNPFHHPETPPETKHPQAPGMVTNAVDAHTNEGDLSTFSELAPVFHEHYESTYTDYGYTFDHIAPAYQYGYELAQDERYQNLAWNEVESQARNDWEHRHPDNAWDAFKDAVYFAWLEATGRD